MNVSIGVFAAQNDEWYRKILQLKCPPFTLVLFLSLILRLKGDLAYNYKGPRTKDDIVEFANRVAG